MAGSRPPLQLDVSHLQRIDLDLPGRRPALRGERPAAPPHSERVTVSPEGEEAGRNQPEPARGEVRWYRAFTYGRGGRVAASDAEDSAGLPSAASLTSPPVNLRNPAAALAAYRESMQPAA